MSTLTMNKNIGLMSKKRTQCMHSAKTSDVVVFKEN